MVVPPTFTTAPPAIASYDYVDIADGTGVIVFQGATTKLVTTTSHFLTKSNIYSNDIESAGSINSAALTKVLDVDFDTSILNFSRIMRGTAIINIPMNISSSATYTGVLIVRISKWDGSTETLIATATSETIGPATGSLSKVMAVHLTLPETPFKVGDAIRLGIEGWIQRTAGGVAGTLTIAHDPQNRDGTKITPTGDATLTTKLVANIPFEINL